MEPVIAPPTSELATTELALGDFRIQPAQNRVARGTDVYRLEPKIMDVLMQLVRRSGQVVSKDELAAAVWAGVFVSDSVVTRAIAELRRVFGDDVRAPRFIETIAKRGYRLLPPVIPAATGTTPARRGPSFTPGQWVRGERFFGREAEIAEILEGPRNGLWVLGTRAIGKTSLLKELERRTGEDPEGRYFPLFWDLQGCDDLDTSFETVLAEATDRLTALGLELGEPEPQGFLRRLARLRRALRERHRVLLLLWDEAEQLLRLDAADPTLLPRLRQALQAQEGIRTVIAAGPALWRLGDRRVDTSPFLHGFAPPLPLAPLTAEAARQLLVTSFGDALPEGVVQELVQESGGHPSLLQLLGSRFASLGDVEQTKESVAADPTVRLHLGVDLDLLSPPERSALVSLALGEIAPTERSTLLSLAGLGLVRALPAGGFTVASPLFRRLLAATRA
jgi:DNA-binding winged helix-turn-helix (wHTH) protein